MDDDTRLLYQNFKINTLGINLKQFSFELLACTRKRLKKVLKSFGDKERQI